MNINNPCFEGMVTQIYPNELQLNKAESTDTEAAFLDVHLLISSGFVSSKFYDKCDDLEFDIEWYLNGDVSRVLSYDVYVSKLIQFASI